MRRYNYNAADTLVIIGNGFDKAHGLNSDYNDFAQKVKDDSLLTFKEKWEKYYVKNCSGCRNCIIFNDQNSWTSFETGICSMTNKMSYLAFDEDYNYHVLTEDINKLNQSYDTISKLLISYLRNAEKTKGDIRKHPLIEQFIPKDSPIVTFNYTKTAEIYSDNVYHIHGSLNENFIVLGYDDRRLHFDVEEPPFLIWNKSYKRDELGLRRYLVKKHISMSKEEQDELFRNLSEYHECLEARGIDESLRKEMRFFDMMIETPKVFAEASSVSNY